LNDKKFGELFIAVWRVVNGTFLKQFSVSFEPEQPVAATKAS